MTKEKKNILFNDLCGRLPYDVVVYNTDPDDAMVGFNSFLTTDMLYKLRNEYDTNTFEFKPFLRSLSNMTPEEAEEYDKLVYPYYDRIGKMRHESKIIEFLNSHFLDFRGLIGLGLAFEAPKGMYNIPNKETWKES